MPEKQTSTTELTSQYIAQVTSDLERNVKEQDRIAADIEALQEQLLALQHDQKVLANMQEALGGARPAAGGKTAAAPPVPTQASSRSKRPKQSGPTGRAKSAGQGRQPGKARQTKQTGQGKQAGQAGQKKAPAATAGKTAATVKKTGADQAAPTGKSTAGKPAAKAPGAAAQPSLVDLIRTHLEEQKEPRSAAEIATALTAAHPDRSIKTTVVRTTLENLVARSSAHRNKQGTSVFYTAATEPAAEPRPAAATA